MDTSKGKRKTGPNEREDGANKKAKVNFFLPCYYQIYFWFRLPFPHILIFVAAFDQIDYID